jgi:predicted DNA-binding transcriptional regulator AlpA
VAMQNIFIKTKFGLKEIIHIDETAKRLGIKPSTLTAYLTREQIFVKKIRIKNLVFFYKEDIDNIIKQRKDHKKDEKMVDLF